MTPTVRVHLLRPRAAFAVALIVTSILAAALGFRAADAQAARGMEIAIQDDPAIVTQSYVKKYKFTRTKALKRARAFGATRLRINVVWANTLIPSQRKAKTRPGNLQYQFPYLDSAIDEAARYGMRVHLSLTPPAPAWATRNHKVGVYKPNTAAFGEWVGILARHFAGRVDRFSIGNEGNLRAWLAPLKSAPSIYRGLYQRGYNAIKANAPGAKVLIGETSPFGRRNFSTSPLAWLRKVLCVNKRYRGRKRSCPKLKADGYAHHPYDFRHKANFKFRGKDNVTMGTLSRLTRALDRLSRSGALRKNGGGRMPVYLTEYGYFASGHRALSKRKRTKYLAQGWSIALKNRRVKSNLQYLIAAPPKGFGSFFNLALFSTRGKAYPQYKTLVRWYKSHRRKVKRPRGAISLPPARP